MRGKDIWDEKYAAKELVWSAIPTAEFVKKVQHLTPGKALDVACGEGRNAIYLAEKRWDVTAVDFSKVAIEKARLIAEKRSVDVNWVVADASKYPFAENEYDLVGVMYLHNSKQEQSRWLPAVIKSVATGGTFVYIGHDRTNIQYGVGGPQDPSVLLSIGETLELLKDFEIEQAEVIERPYADETGHGGAPEMMALDAIICAKKRG